MLFTWLAWLSFTTLISRSEASISFLHPPNADEDQSNHDQNPVYGIGQVIDIELHIGSDSDFYWDSNLWIEGPSADEAGANDINNFIVQLTTDMDSSDSTNVSSETESFLTPSEPTPPPNPSSYDPSIVYPRGAIAATLASDFSVTSEPTDSETPEIKPRGKSLTYSDGSVRCKWTVRLVTNPIAQSLMDQHGFALARFRLDDIMNPQHKLARSRYFNITNRAVTPVNQGLPRSSTFTSFITSTRAPSSSSTTTSIPDPPSNENKGTNTAGTFTKRVKIGVAIGGTFAGLLTFGAVAFFLWRRFRMAALIRLDDETNSSDTTDEVNAIDIEELEWNEKVGIGRPEPIVGFEIKIVRRLETIHEDSDESSLNS